MLSPSIVSFCTRCVVNFIHFAVNIATVYWSLDRFWAFSEHGIEDAAVAWLGWRAIWDELSPHLHEAVPECISSLPSGLHPSNSKHVGLIS